MIGEGIYQILGFNIKKSTNLKVLVLIVIRYILPSHILYFFCHIFHLVQTLGGETWILFIVSLNPQSLSNGILNIEIILKNMFPKIMLLGCFVLLVLFLFMTLKYITKICIRLKYKKCI